MMRLSLEVARHFWRGQQIATWEASDQFPADLLSWVKTHYAELVGTKPDLRDHEKGVVYFLYRDEREAHGRLATRLTACWAESRITDHDAVLQALQACQADLHDGALTVTVDVDMEPLQPTRSNRSGWGYAGALLLAGAVITFLVLKPYSSDRKTDTSDLKADTSQLKSDTEQGKKKNTHNSKWESLSDNYKSLCELWQKKGKDHQHRCFKYFLSQKCSEDKKVGQYRSFSDELWKSHPDTAKKFDCPKEGKTDSDLPNALKSLGVTKEEIKTFKSNL